MFEVNMYLGGFSRYYIVEIKSFILMITTNSQSKSKFYWKSSKAKEVLKIVFHLIKRRFETFYKT